MVQGKVYFLLSMEFQKINIFLIKKPKGHNTKNVFSNVIADKEFLELHNLNIISTKLSSER